MGFKMRGKHVQQIQWNKRIAVQKKQVTTLGVGGTLVASGCKADVPFILNKPDCGKRIGHRLRRTIRRRVINHHDKVCRSASRQCVPDRRLEELVSIPVRNYDQEPKHLAWHHAEALTIRPS
jgi:hypothetical protein